MTEEKPKNQTPDPKPSKIKRILFILAAFLLFLIMGVGAGFFFIQHRFKTLDREIAEGFQQLQTMSQRRIALVEELKEVNQKYFKGNSKDFLSLRDAAETARVTHLSKFSDFNSFFVAQKQVTLGFSHFVQDVQHLHKSASDPQWKAFKLKLEGTENRIALARQHLNQVVRARNDLIDQPPYSWVAQLKKIRDSGEL